MVELGVVPNPDGWLGFWFQAGPWLILCVLFTVLAVVGLVRQRGVDRDVRAAAELEAVVVAARAARVLDRRSSRVRAVEAAVEQITVVLVPDGGTVLIDGNSRGRSE